MDERRFTEDYHETRQLRDGRKVVLRLIRPEDKVFINEGLAKMSPESRFRRFLSHREALTERELAYLTEIDQEDHVAIGVGALDEEGQVVDGLGVARFVLLCDESDAEKRIAEAAIAVVDNAQGVGLGKLLFRRLVWAAVEREITIFRFDVLTDNEAMLGLLEDLFPDLSMQIQDGIVSLDCPLPRSISELKSGRGTGPMYRLFKLAAEGVVRVMQMTLLNQPAIKGMMRRRKR